MSKYWPERRALSLVGAVCLTFVESVCRRRRVRPFPIALLLRLAVLPAALLVPAGAAEAASIWTPVDTGTTESISAVQFPTATEIVFATSSGHIFHETSSGTFAQSTLSVANVVGFTDLAMSPDGTKGVAVGPSGAIYRSTDSGATWTKISGTQEYPGYCGNGTPTLSTLTDDLLSAQFADNSTAYVTGKNRDVLKSTDGGATFTEVNKFPSGGNLSCQVSPNEDLTDSQWLDAANGFVISRYFGDTYLTTSGFSSPLGPRKGEATNSYQGPVELALDTADPTHLWAVNGDPNVGELGFMFSIDGGTTWSPVANDGHQVGLRDIANSGLTVVAAGDGGDIYTSPDGKTFYRQVSADLPSNNWQAVAVLDATHAVVAGANGRMVLTGSANQIPDSVAPTGTVSGPASLAIGQFGTYTINATDNPGGTGIDPASFSWSATGVTGTQNGSTARFAFGTPGAHVVTVSFKDLAGNTATATRTVTVSTPPPLMTGSQSETTGGGTVGTAKKLTVTGHQHFIPVRVSSKAPRRFVLTLLTLKGHHRYVPAVAVTLKNGGKRTLTIKLPTKVKQGSYLLVTRVFTLSGRSVGRQIKFVLLIV